MIVLIPQCIHTKQVIEKVNQKEMKKNDFLIYWILLKLYSCIC